MSTSSVSISLSSLVIDENNSTKQDHVIRNTVTFHPSIWGDQFLVYDEKDDLVAEKQLVEELTEEIRKKLFITASSIHEPLQQIQLIDAIQRLGVAYHFEKEIEEALQHVYRTYGHQGIHNNNNLQSVSLWFRILRQQGFNVSPEIFKNHMDEKGNLLSNDVESMLALYEASYMRVEGEKVLDDALKFTKTHLAIIAQHPSCDSSLRTQIQEALRQPLRKRLPRLEAVRYIPIYQQQSSHNQLLLKLAKLDFNMLQSMHKKELSQICKWWKDLDMQNKLPFVRDRLIEGYFCILGIYFEPHHSRLRMFLIKSCMWLIVMDDTFDNYGTYEELKIFTEVVERWSISCLDLLPEYMKVIYLELVNIHQEMEESLEKEGKTYHIYYVKEMAKEYTRSLLAEAKWLKDGYMPTLDEYISNSLITTTYAVVIEGSYVGGPDMLVTEDSFKWVATHPPLVKASCLILRLMNDIATHKEEQERSHVASSIECYIKETGATEEEACEYFSKQVEDAWKVINRDSLKPTDVPFPLVKPVINLARISDVVYKGSINGYNHAGKELIQNIKSLLVHPLI
ncbi:Terpene synthase, metal-binding domain-containing protein [Cynara cardunculus var. scolymus]|uniref:Terpene synthase, metal-binding domain-containing protein n=2 Tax=Cynara cardunculus var. scolymus TaxID=59895 RepID=A0A118JXI9_CYNCS|nr:Terpene synthase, metal-binding domain-containing protein [Cynara cardunculus var. scolymus]